MVALRNLPIDRYAPIFRSHARFHAGCAPIPALFLASLFIQRYTIIIQSKSKGDKIKPYSKNSTHPEAVRPLYPATTCKRRVLYILENDSLLPDPLRLQLGYFGYEVKSFSRLEVLLGDLNGREQQVLVLSCEVLDQEPLLIETLNARRNQYGESLRTIFLSHTDDFDIRLRVVRAGGDAFFLYPVDVTKLVDCVEGFFAPVEEDPYHLLIIDRDESAMSDVASSLQRAGMVTSVARKPDRILDLMVEFKPELILMAVDLGECRGVELAQIIRQEDTFVGIPIVFMCDSESPEHNLRTLCRGGDDFLMMPIEPELLIQIVRSKAERTRSLRYFMERDSLTGLLNHTNLKENLNREMLRARRASVPLSFAMIDVDHFKQVNDSYGHLTGDRILKGLSRLLLETLRRTDLVGRYGGEEFGIILINTGQEDALKIMENLRDTFSRLPQKSGREEFFVTFSCGVASYPEYQYHLTEEADRALYRAKEAGRNRVIGAEA